jgi:hypothetical protein
MKNEGASATRRKLVGSGRCAPDAAPRCDGEAEFLLGALEILKNRLAKPLSDTYALSSFSGKPFDRCAATGQPLSQLNKILWQ